MVNTAEFGALPVIESAPVTEAAVGIPYLYDVDASGSPQPVFSLVDAPQGATIDATSGVISWTPAREGEYPVTVAAVNAAGSAVQAFSILVNPAPVAPRITSEPVVTGTAGEPYRYDVVASGVPSPAFALLQHPDGMAVEPTTGAITWLPTAGGEYEVVVEAVNIAGAASQPYTVVVTDPIYEFPGASWPAVAPSTVGMDEQKLDEARAYALTGGGAGIITRHGKAVMAWGDTSRRYDLKSTGKSIGMTALGLALKDGLMDLDDAVQIHHPEIGVPPDSNAATGWLDEMTVRHLATQTAGFDKSGGYTELLFEPGTAWHYSDGGPNWLAEAVTLRYGQDLNTLLFARVFTPLGIDDDDLTWRDNIYRDTTINGVARREFGGISANADAMARIGYLYLRDGQWDGVQILEKSFTDAVGVVDASLVGLPEVNPARDFNASDHYGLLWWNNADGSMENVPRDAYWSWGLFESLIVVIPSLDIVAARTGWGWQAGWSADYAVIEPFIEVIALSVTDEPNPAGWAPSVSASAGQMIPILR